MPVNYRKHLFYLILITSILKLFISGCIELGNDEVYYYTYAIQPDWNHFDHPPMIGLLMRLTSLNLLWVNDVSMRLGAIISCAVATWFIFQTGKLISNERVGWFAALLYNCSVYTSIIAGLFILPDSPQMPFYTASLYIMSRLAFKDDDKEIKWWLLLGLTIGLAMLCKVHGLYLWAGFGLFLLLRRIKWLFNWRMYAGIIITLVCFIPILYWNVQNHFITYTYHSARVTNHTLQLDSFFRELTGEFAYQNPIVFVLIVLSIIHLIGKKKSSSLEKNLWLLCMGLPMIFLFWGISLFNDTLPHWSGPGYIPLFFIAATYLDNKTQRKYPVFIQSAAGLLALTSVIAVAIANYAPFNLGSQDKENYGEYCPTLDINGWNHFGTSFKALAQKDVEEKNMKPHSPIIINKWFPGGHIEFYVARQIPTRVIAIGDLDDVHKFAWLNKERKPLQLGDDAYCIVPSNVPFNVKGNYSRYFSVIEAPVIFNQIRGGKVVRYFYVYRMKDCIALPKPILE